MGALTNPRIVRMSIRGRVQGVGFRAWTGRQAGRLGLEGWVRNRPDGSVEAVAAGPPDVVDALIAACRRGPPLAAVEALEVVEAGEEALAERGAADGFVVLKG